MIAGEAKLADGFPRQTRVKTLIVLGSGGHTAEMLKLLGSMDRDKYEPRCYVVAETDRLSGVKALSAEQQFHTAASASTSARPVAEVCSIPRSREVGQSFITSVWTTLVALAAAFLLVWRQHPGLVLVNGPGTCIPLCFSAWLLRTFARRPCRIVYVESIARVKELSLSAKILYRLDISDALLVQWPPLQERYPHTIHCGRLY